MRILIAEDDPFSRRFLQKTLEKWSYEVVATDDGLKALEILQRDDAPRLAIVDWMMPGLDGLELCRQIRRADATRLTYVIVLTAKGGVEDLVQAMEAGADDFTTKSFDVRELKVRLRAGERISKLEETLRRLATRDTLTDLWNRSAILEMLERELSRSERSGVSVGLVMADLDYFKRVNDMHGHAGGDAVLVEVARRMRSGLREYDGAGRYGGEEFLIVLPGASAGDTAEIAERIRAAVTAEPIQLAREQIIVTASFGTAVATEDQNVGADALIRTADLALYRAKRAGRNRVEASTEVCDAGASAKVSSDSAAVMEGILPLRD